MILLYYAIWQPCYTAVGYLTILVYRGIIDIIIDTVLYMTIILHRFGRQHNTHTNTDIISTCIHTLRHCNTRGCEFGQR